ncbi:MAG: hypothetical protein J5I90_19250 [Caldilineales bacterium]|nr:hypothetical protein [Caldilineales bacterium]
MRKFVIFIIPLLFLLTICGIDFPVFAFGSGHTPPPPGYDGPAYLPDNPDFASLKPMSCGEDGEQASGAIYRICMPAQWNGDLLIYAHGYVSPEEPIGIPEDQLVLPDGTSLPDIANFLGYAFATTSYSTNGLAVQQGLADLTDLVVVFTAEYQKPGRVILVGVSEGGLMATLAAERHADVFDGALALCGPYGGFRRQVDYFGDARALFDYYFPDLLPPSATEIPQSLIDDWETTYTDQILPVLQDPANSSALDLFLATSGAAIDASEPDSKIQSTERLLWYSVHATNDASVKLGGQPFDNMMRHYAGSEDDETLNQEIARYAADKSAVDEIVIDYETTGFLRMPLVLAHTAGDPVVPFWHMAAYVNKARAVGQPWLQTVSSPNYGHCAFSSIEVLNAFNRLLLMVNNPEPPAASWRLFTPFVADSQ